LSRSFSIISFRGIEYIMSATHRGKTGSAGDYSCRRYTLASVLWYDAARFDDFQYSQ
jgi:hypothetical protein